MIVRFFGRLRTAIGDELSLDLPAQISTTEQLRSFLGERHPQLLDPSVRIAIDDQLVTAPAALAGAREIAFLPAVSGG